MEDGIKKFSNPNEKVSSDSEEFDWKIVFNFCIRNKAFLSKFSLAFLIFGFIFSFFPKKVWEGQFQIVLNLDNNQRPLGRSNPTIARLMTGDANNLQTEVGILQSPSVLMPVYEFMMSKKDKVSNNYQGFLGWKNQNLKIKLEDDTSILNISYRDRDKTLIIPLLEKMSSSYQNYSQLRKNKLLEASGDHLKKEIEAFKITSANSLKKAEEFAIDKDLTFFDLSPGKITDDLFQNNISMNLLDSAYESEPLSIRRNLNTNLEIKRVNAVNEIKKIDIQLKRIEEMNNLGELKYITRSIPIGMDEEGLLYGLEKIDNDLVELRSKYTEEDMSIKRLLEKRIFMLEALKERSINYLKAKRLEAEATKQSVMRPKGVLLEYKELIRNADRDESTLINLENQLRRNDLELSKQKYPWELITKPALLDIPVSPNKRNFTFFFFLIGLFLGAAYKFYGEKKSGKIFELKNILDIRSFQFVQRISLHKNQSNIEKFMFIKEYIKNNSQKNANLILIGDLIENKKNKIRKTFLEEINFKLVFIKNLTDIENTKNNNINLIVLSIGEVTYSQIENLDRYAELLKINIPGLILVDN